MFLIFFIFDKYFDLTRFFVFRYLLIFSSIFLVFAISHAFISRLFFLLK
jgi:hypothetical protein